MLRLGDGTLYPLLYRLERKGQIRSAWEKGPTGKDRKVYHITRSGLRQITDGLKKWHSLCHIMGEFMGEEWRTA